MFDINNAAVTPAELAAFVAVVAGEVDSLGEGASFVLAVPDGDAVVMLVTDEPTRPSALSETDQLLATRRRMAAIVSTVGWSPAPEVPTSPAWIIVAVGRGGGPAVAGVRRIVQDDHWTRIPPDGLPWAALSTAAGLRAYLEHGEPLRLKHGASPELYLRPDEWSRPPLDDRGEL